MLDLSVIILTYNEEIHIQRCIKNISPIAKDIFVVDSFSTDKAIEIAKSLGAKAFQNKKAICEQRWMDEHIQLMEGVAVGARAAVVKDVEPWTVIGGNPAKFIKKREIKDE